MKVGRSRWVLVVALVVASLVSAAATWLVLSWRTIYEPAPTIVRGIEGGTREATSNAFTARLRRTYPPGTSERRLMQHLASDGFRTGWAPPPGERGAIRNWSRFPCNMYAGVFWTVDARQQITGIRGAYHEAGCL